MIEQTNYKFIIKLFTNVYNRNILLFAIFGNCSFFNNHVKTSLSEMRPKNKIVFVLKRYVKNAIIQAIKNTERSGNAS